MLLFFSLYNLFWLHSELVKAILRPVEIKLYSIFSHLTVLHQMDDGEHRCTDTCWEHCLWGLRYMVVGRVFGGVFLI